MKGIMRKLIYFGATAALAMSAHIASARVEAHVNTGNPAFPFPQFMDYSPECKSLATHNAPGVTHAEMERRMLDAWQHICNNTMEHGYEVDGVQYLIPDAKNAETHCECAEGDGYYLLPSAIFGDKAYFDGYYMSMHDRMFIGTERFYDGGTNSYDGYSKGLNGSGAFGAGSGMALGSYNSASASATDGDVDIALALLIAAKQWGEKSGIQTRFGELNYKEEALKYIRAMVDPVDYNGLGKYVSGDVGFDGYLKGGSHQANLTTWMTNGSGKTYKGYVPENGGSQKLYFDYLAPAYFNEYAKFLELDSKSTEWQISQCKRCEASSDYLMRKLYEVSDNTIPVCGEVESVSDTEFKFTSAQFSEDFRAGWRTILNYVWHGNPTTTWNPVSHEVESGSNSYEKDMAMRYAQFLANPQDERWGNDCNAIGDMGLKFWGPYTLRDKMDFHGKIGEGFPLNWIHGAGSPAAVAAQDFELMGQMFRHCVIAWDDLNFESYETSSPVYFHEWFKLLGMLVLSGNFQAPSKMVPQANCKVYHKVDKTYAFAGDTVTFTVNIRNYGSVDAKNTIVKFGLPAGFDFVSSDKGKLSGDSVVWDRATLSGFRTTTGLEPTIDSMKIVCRLNDNIDQGRYCTTARIECRGGTGWTSDEYPNNITDVMERNCVDVVARALKIDKKANRDKINPDNIAQFKINFENSAEAGWINGGRPGVRLSYGHLPVANPEATDQIVSFYRLFNDADEAYINYGNYRVSYYMYDPSLICFSGTNGCDVGWAMACDFYQGGLKEALKITHETTVEGEDPERPGKKYNQRIIVQFADQLATVSQHLQQYASSNKGDGLHVHEGGGATLLLNMRMACSQGGKMFDLTDDWSYSDEWASSKQNDLHYPIIYDNTDPNNLDQPITSWDRHSCGTPEKYCDRILVEEWDGYTWRRVLGNGPMPGRDVYNVVLRDTLPKGMEFLEFVGTCPLEEFGGSWKTEKTSDGRDIVVWTINRMMIKQKGTITYNANITFPSGAECKSDDEDIINRAWIWGDKESKIYGADTITVTCSKVPEPRIKSTLEKTVDKEKVQKEDVVEYTLNYEQTHGAIFENAESKSSDWDLNAFSISDGNVTTVSNQTGTAKYKYSKGKNFHIKMDLNPATYATFQILLRQGSANPISMQIKPDLSQRVLMVTTYQGSTVKQPMEEVLFKGSTEPISVILDLNSDVLRMWVNKDTTSGYNYSVTGLADGEGYFGFKNGSMEGQDSYGTHKFTNIHVHTDYAYDLRIIDRKPEEIKFISADEGGELLGDSIVWEFEQGIDNPIPFGTKYKVTWKGMVENCDELVINYAYVHLLGHKDGTIEDDAVSKCVSEDCEGVQKAELTFKDGETVNTICAGDSAVLVAVATPASNKYLYQFYLDGEPIGEASKADTLVVKEPGKYKVKISDPDCPTATTPTSPSVTLTVNALPDEVVPEKSICENESLPIGDVTIDDYTIEWYKDAHTLFAVDVAEIPAEDVVETYFYVLTDVNGCKSKPKPWNVEIKELPSTPKIAEKEIEAPLTAGATKNITDKVTPSKTGNKIVWYDSEGEAEISAPILVDLSTEGPQKYVVRESQNGCLGDTLSITVVVTSSQKPNPSDTTICVGSQIEVASLVKKEEDAELIWYDENGDEISDPGTYTSTEAGKKTFTVAQKKGEAVSEKTAFTITTVDVAKLKEDVEINYCAGEAAEELKAEVDETACPNCKTPTSYQWYLNESRTNDLNPNTEVTEKTATYYYHVEPIYQIPNGEKCVGKKVDVNVVVNFVPAVITKSVSYVLTDAVNDKFPSLESAAKPISSDYSIEWYTEDGELIGTTAPSPTMADVDLSKALTTLTYKVKQVKNDCRSEFSTVTVFISKIPTPTVKNAYYCEGDTPDPLSSYVTPSTGYTLVWYNGDPEKGGREDDMPTINTTSQRSGETVKDEIVDKYYVAQRNTEGTSGAVFVEAHIFAKPTIITRDTASCEEPINVNMLWLPKTTRVEFYTKFGEYFREPIVSETKKGLQLEGVISFTVEGEEKTCRSDRSTINVEIHKLDFDIDAPAEVCPNSEAELNVNMTVKEIEDSTLSYSWKGYAANADNILSDPINKETEFSVTVTDGVCKVTKTKTVGITNGKIDGSIKISEDGSSDPGVNEIATKEGAKFESCGGDVTIVADVAGTDFMWDNAIAGNTITKKGGIYKLKYKDVNGCETGFAVEIIPTPIEDNTIAFDSTICEGESITLVADLTAGVEATNVVWKKDDSEVGNDASLVLKKVTSANAGKYTYEASYKKCKLSGTFGTVTVLPRPTYDFLDVDPVCIGSSEIIGIENLNPTTADIKWDSDPTLIVNGNGMTATVTPVESETTYSFTISQNGGCKIVEKINVSASKPIDFSINGEDTTVCENSIGNLKFGLNIVEGDVLSYEWRDIDKDSVVSSSSVLKFNEKKIGTYRYKVMLTSEACDPQFDDIEVTIAGAPLVDTVTKIDYHNVEIVPNTSYGESPYMYKVDAAEEFSTNEEVYVKYGHHTVVIKDANGCMSSYEFDTQAPDFEIPVVITPNGDGDNDAFMSHVISEAYPDARVTIYDRYGKKLTEIRGDESWDGMYNGHKMPSTDYWYEIWIEEIRKKYVGHFTLINE